MTFIFLIFNVFIFFCVFFATHDGCGVNNQMNITPSQPTRTFLKSQRFINHYKKLSAQSATTMAECLLTVLPDELWDMIFEFIHYPMDICNAIRVSNHAFYTLVRKHLTHFGYWQRPDCQSLTRIIPPTWFCQFRRLCKIQLDVSLWNDDQWYTFMNHQYKLKDLELVNVLGLSDNFLSALPTTLKKLNIHFAHEWPMKSLFDGSKNISFPPELHTLILSGFDFSAFLQQLPLNHVNIDHLRHLSMEVAHNQEALFPTIHQQSLKFANLTFLHLKHQSIRKRMNMEYDIEMVVVDGAHFPRQLKTIIMDPGYALDFNTFDALPKSLTTLDVICVGPNRIDQQQFELSLSSLLTLPLLELQLEVYSEERYTFPTSILAQLPRNMHTLTLIHFYWDETTCWTTSLPPSLRALTLGSIDRLFTDDAQIQALPRQLKHFICKEGVFYDETWVASLTPKSLAYYPRNLSTLHILGGHCVTNESIHQLPSSLTSLGFDYTSLTHNFVTPTNAHLFKNLKKFRRLDYIDTNVTDVAILQHLPSITTIPKTCSVTIEQLPQLSTHVHTLNLISIEHYDKSMLQFLPARLTSLSICMTDYQPSESYFLHLPRRLQKLDLRLNSIKNQPWHQLPLTLSELTLRVVYPTPYSNSNFTLDESMLTYGPPFLLRLNFLSNGVGVGTREFWNQVAQSRIHLKVGGVLKSVE